MDKVPSLLNEQYRMHPKIAEFPSNRFYGGRVKSKVDPEDRPLPRGFRWPNRRVPVVFIDVSPDAVYAPAGAAGAAGTGAGAAADVGDDAVGRMLGSDDGDEEGSGGLRGLSFRDLMELPSPPGAVFRSNTTDAGTAHTDVTIYRSRPDGVETIVAGPGPGGRARAAPISGGFESTSNASQTSYYNEAEAEVLVGVVETLVGQGQVKLNEIGVITPYNAQVGVVWVDLPGWDGQQRRRLMSRRLDLFLAHTPFSPMQSPPPSALGAPSGGPFPRQRLAGDGGGGARR